MLIVMAALLPLVVSSIFQSAATWNGMQQSAITSLRANAKAVAERERDPFLVASRLLVAAAGNPDIMGITANCSNALSAGFKGYEGITNFVRADAEGNARCSILPFRPDTNFAAEPWWKKTISSDSITVSQPVMGPVSKVQIIIIGLTLRDEDGRFIGTLTAGVDVSKLRQSIMSAPEAKSGIIAIVSNNGELVAGSTNSIPFALPVGPVEDRPGVLEARNGKKWIYDAVPLGGPELYVLYAQPNAEIMSAASAQFRASILWPIAAILFASLAIWFGTNRLVIRWLKLLRELSAEFTKGDFTGNRQAFANAPAELAELSDDLHDMAQVIEHRTQDLTEALQATTDLTREVHHRVKNNLQIVTSLLTMQASRMKDDNAQAALHQSRSRIAALALIHRLVYEKDSGNERGEVAVDNLMDELCKQLRSANPDKRHIDFACDTDNFAIPMDLAVPLALFTVEAVTNSYRHAFVEGVGGHIKLTFKRDGDAAVMTVQDDGKGYDAEHLSGSEMGSELMHAFSSQLNGNVGFSSVPGNGSLTTLRFPLTEQTNNSTGQAVS
jgi:two-component sensor histidine kinase